MRDEAASEFHDAYRMGGLTVVGDHAFADPQILLATDPADGKVPLKIRWFNDSYIEVPVQPLAR